MPFTTHDKDGFEDKYDVDIVFGWKGEDEGVIEDEIFIMFHRRLYRILNHHQNILSVLLMRRTMDLELKIKLTKMHKIWMKAMSKVTIIAKNKSKRMISIVFNN